MHILAINPLIRNFATLGACEQDRLAGLNLLQDLGHTVRLTTYASPNNSLVDSKAFYAAHNLDVELVPYALRRLTWARLHHPAYLDGAAWEHRAPDFWDATHAAINSFKPDLLWCHATYTWPVLHLARQAGIPSVIRSVNFEPEHLRQQHGQGLTNQIRFAGKWLGERKAAALSDVLVAITPDEQAIYQRLDPTACVRLLPLRTLPGLLREMHPVRQTTPLRVFFMGANYGVPHNREALAFIVLQLAPIVYKTLAKAIQFHILGGKAPSELQQQSPPNVTFEGFVPDLDAFLEKMDVAVMPSVSGVGMQQKVFEALCRGFPTLTHSRALAGYPIVPEQEVLLADDVNGFVTQLTRLQNHQLRHQLSQNAHRKATELFSTMKMQQLTTAILNEALTAP